METGTLVHVDPSDLLLDTNVRTDVRIDPTFKASIKTNGVLVPVVAVQTEDGLHVRFGQRRTIAAAEVGEPAIPVYVVKNDGQAERIIGQLAENDHRASLSGAERIEAVQQLSLIGISPAQIAKRTHIKRTDVDGAVAIIGDEKATKIAMEHSLAVAGWCAEFAGDEVAVTEIVRQADWGGEDRARHTVERFRQERTYRADYDVAAATVTDQTVIARPSRTEAPKSLDELVDEKGRPITAEAHRQCPGHAIVLDEFEDYDPEDIEDVDPAELDTPDLEAAGRKWTVGAYCVDPVAHGHQSKWGGTASGSSSKAVDPTAKEKESAERKRVIAGNKAWDASCVVRAEFVAKMLQRKAAPSDAVLFILRALSGRIDLGDGREALRQRIGAKDGYRQITIPDLTAPAATMALLAYVVTAMEKGTTRNDWRTVQEGTTLYLKVLESWGYVLSDAEVAASGGKTFTVAAVA